MKCLPSWKIMLCLAAIFAAGLAIGSLATLGLVRYKLRQHAAHSSKFAQAATDRLESQLRLTPEQMQQVRPIVAQAADRLRALQVETFGRAHRILAEAGDGLTPHLDEKQKARLAEIVAERREQLRRAFGRDLPPPAR